MHPCSSRNGSDCIFVPEHISLSTYKYVEKERKKGTCKFFYRLNYRLSLLSCFA